MDISVVIPLYNKKDTIRRAIESVLSQTILPKEIIVVNDGSSDDSENIVRAINHPLIKLVEQENQGVSSARNKGIELSRNEWIAFLDADDVWKITFLQEMKTLSLLFPECSVLASSYIMQDSLGYSKPIILNKIPFEETSGKLTNYFEVASCSSPPLWSSAIVIQRSTLIRIGGFPLGITSGEDLLTWALLAKYYEIAYCINPLAIYFLPERGLVDRRNRLISLDLNDQLVTEKFKNILDLQNKNERFYLAEWLKIISKQYLNLNMKSKASKAIFRSLYLRPFKIKLYVYILILITPFCMYNYFLKK